MTKLNQETIDEITLYVENGMTNQDACKMAGIAPTTLYRWLREQSNDLQVSLSEAMELARIRRKERMLQTIFDAASNGCWQAAAWYLERTCPEEYGKPDRYHDQGITEAVEAVKELTASIKAKAEASNSAQTAR